MVGGRLRANSPHAYPVGAVAVATRRASTLVQNNPKTSANLALAMLLVIVGCTANPRPGSERAIVPSPTSIDGGAGDAPGRTADDDAGQPPNLPDAGLPNAADGGAIEPPAFAQQPTSLQATSGRPATFTAVVLQAVSYQWRK